MAFLKQGFITILFISMLRMKMVLSQINFVDYGLIPKWNSSMGWPRHMVWIVMPNSIRSTSLNFCLMKRSLNQKMIQISDKQAFEKLLRLRRS